MGSLSVFDYAAMAVYLIALIAIGCFSQSGKKSTKDFILGGGKMPVLALGISCLMAALSAFSIVMIPGEIFSHGLSFWVLTLVSPFLIIATTAIFMKFYFKIGAYTPFEYLEKRYSPAVRLLVAAMTFYSRLIYLGMVLFSTSKILEGAAGWPCWVTIIVMSGISLAFTSAGGLKAVVWTDVLQFIVLVGGLFCILGTLFLRVDGGLFGGIAYAFQNGRGVDTFSDPTFYHISPYVRLSFWLLAFANFILVPFSIMASDQMTVQRLLASGSYKNAMRTQIVNTLLTIPTTLILFVIGLLVFSFFHQHPDLMAQVKSGDTALFQFISREMPPPLPGLVIIGMFAAVISTLNAVFNSMAAVYVKEFHIRYIDRSCPEEKQVKLTRLWTIIIGVTACALGLTVAYAADWISSSVVEVQIIFSVFDVIVIPAFIFAVLSSRASSIMIWVISGLLWGLKAVMIFWYLMSSRALKVWNAAREAAADAASVLYSDCGWAARPISWEILLPFAAGGCLLALIAWLRFKRKQRFATLSLVFSAFLFGNSIALLLWSIISAGYCTEQPQALSFQWVGLPVNLAWIIAGALWLTLGPKQPKEKFQGLTLFTQENSPQN